MRTGACTLAEAEGKTVVPVMVVGAEATDDEEAEEVCSSAIVGAGAGAAGRLTTTGLALLADGRLLLLEGAAGLLDDAGAGLATELCETRPPPPLPLAPDGTDAALELDEELLDKTAWQSDASITQPEVQTSVP